MEARISNSPPASPAVQGADDPSVLEQIINGLGDCFWAIDRDWRFTFFNSACEAFFGVTREQALGRRMEEVTPLAAMPELQSRIAAAFEAPLEPPVVFPSRVKPGRWMEMRLFPVASGVGSTFRDVTDRVAAEQAVTDSEARLRDSEARLRLTLENTGLGFWDLDLQTGEGVWSDTTFGMFGMRRPEGGRASLQDWRERVHPEDLERIEAEHRVATASGEPYTLRYRIRRADDGATRWILVYARALKNDGTPVRSLGVVVDETDKRAAEDRERLLMREVDHRAKNVLAVVQALVRLTPPAEPKVFAAKIEGRVSAIARAHTLLARGRWSGVSLRELLLEEVGDHGDGERVSLQGPEVGLAPEAAQPVGMVLHELATNAVKYGALGAGGGRVDIGWSRHTDSLVVRWRETGGPLVTTPKRTGFGSLLVREIVERQLSGRFTPTWRPEGLEVELELPVRNLIGDGGVNAPPARPRARVQDILAGARVLVAEDDRLVALDIVAGVRQLGGEPLGPAASVEEALALIEHDSLDLAILDVNLRGETIAPAAAALKALGAPFLYATGYGVGVEGLPEAPVLLKPFVLEELATRLAEIVPTDSGVD
jgi:PAS domain S-box-containing protein